MALERFHSAQASEPGGFATALAELEAGRKTSHWIWYIFPQLAELGRSPTAKFYGLADLAEARAYLADPVLRERLRLVVTAAARQLAAGVALTALMGGETDSRKLVSSLTLFELAAHEGSDGESARPEVVALAALCGRVLDAAARQGFPRCPLTRPRGTGDGC